MTLKRELENTTKLEKKMKVFVERLLKWYATNKRHFSWRKRHLTPYEVLVLEILLQRTMAERVNEIFPEFIRRYPNPRALHKASERELLSLLKTLGLQKRRIKLLKALAKEMIDEYGKNFPTEIEEIVKLSGVGRYGASAVLCFSYGKPVALVDTNIARVIHRIFAQPVRDDPSSDDSMWRFVQRILPKDRARDFNWGLIDFGAMVCRAKNPLCNQCPMADICAHATGE